MTVKYDLAKYGNDQKTSCQNGVLKCKLPRMSLIDSTTFCEKRNALGIKYKEHQKKKKKSKTKEETWSEKGQFVSCDHFGISMTLRKIHYLLD